MFPQKQARLHGVRTGMPLPPFPCGIGASLPITRILVCFCAVEEGVLVGFMNLGSGVVLKDVLNAGSAYL